MDGPHDKLFRRIVGEPAQARELLRSILPQAVVAAIDWDSLAGVDGSFVDEALREHHTDLLFTASGPVLLYVLFEHKSDDDPMTAFQLLRYIVRIWERHMQQKPQPRTLPPVLPVVLHHGDAPWHGARRLGELIELGGLPPAVERLQPELTFVLDDLALCSEADLGDRMLSAVSTLALLCLQHLRGCEADEALGRIERWQGLFRLLLDQAGGQVGLSTLIYYVLKTVPAVRKRLDPMIHKMLDHRADAAMRTAADEIAEEAEQKAYARTLRRLLEQKFGRLPDGVIARIGAASTTELERLLDQVLTANTLEEALRD